MVLQILFLGPSNLLEPNASFAQMSQKLIVSPIVKTLVFSKVPEKASHAFSHLHNKIYLGSSNNQCANLWHSLTLNKPLTVFHSCKTVA